MSAAGHCVNNLTFGKNTTRCHAEAANQMIRHTAPQSKVMQVDSWIKL